MRLPIERIFDLDEVAEIVGEGRGVIERIFDRERLALRIHREIVFERGRVGSGSMTSSLEELQGMVVRWVMNKPSLVGIHKNASF